MKTVKLFIDDIRNPPNGEWIVARSSKEAIEILKNLKYCPDISFDHDLGNDDNAMTVVKYIINRDLKENGKFIKQNTVFKIHSANPVGRENIRGLLNSYISFKWSKK